jgi:hypothetical protein
MRVINIGLAVNRAERIEGLAALLSNLADMRDVEEGCLVISPNGFIVGVMLIEEMAKELITLLDVIEQGPERCKDCVFDAWKVKIDQPA